MIKLVVWKTTYICEPSPVLLSINANAKVNHLGNRFMWITQCKTSRCQRLLTNCKVECSLQFMSVSQTNVRLLQTFCTKMTSGCTDVTTERPTCVIFTFTNYFSACLFFYSLLCMQTFVICHLFHINDALSTQTRLFCGINNQVSSVVFPISLFFKFSIPYRSYATRVSQFKIWLF